MSRSHKAHFLSFIPHPGFVTGREGLLAEMHRALQTSDAAILVCGIGGIGKTTAALAYLNSPEYGGIYDHVVWIEISTTLPEAFARQRDLQERLGIRVEVENCLSQNNVDGVVLAILDALKKFSGKKLLALDNANDRDEIKYWKSALLYSGCRLLITSRAEIPNFEEVQVSELEPDPASLLFWHHYNPHEVMSNKNGEAEEIIRLINDISGHTLLIEMFGKIGRQAGMSISALRLHAAKGFVFSKKLQRTVDVGHLIERKGLDEGTLENLVLFLFRGIAPGMTEQECKLLSQITVLPPCAHTPELLAQIFSIDEDNEASFFDELDNLHKRGVPLKKDGAYQLHRLVRAVAIREMKPAPENCTIMLQGVMNLLNFDESKDSPVLKFPYISYGEAILEVFKDKVTMEICCLKNNLAILYSHLGNYSRRKELLEETLAFEIIHYGENHPEIAIIQNNLANAYADLGDYNRARDLLESTLAFDKLTSSQTLAVRQSNLAIVYSKLGDFNRARDLLESALAKELENFGENHPTVTVTQSNLANVYRNMGEYERARDLLEIALTNDFTAFGANHPRVATRRNNLALVYYSLGHFDKAEQLWQEALQILLRNFDEDHPHVKKTQNYLDTLPPKEGI